MGTYTENIRLYEPGHRPPRLVAHRRRAWPVRDAARTKRYTRDITAIVTVADDGGGSRRAARGSRDAAARPISGAASWHLPTRKRQIGELLNYRFTEGSIAGQSSAICSLRR